MILDFIMNVSVVCFMLSLFVGAYMFFCRDYRHFNGIQRKDDIRFWDAFLNRFYFILITFTTIGYGDITPKSKTARIITISILLFIMIVILKSFDTLISYYNTTFTGELNKYIDISGNIA